MTVGLWLCVPPRSSAGHFLSGLSQGLLRAKNCLDDWDVCRDFPTEEKWVTQHHGGVPLLEQETWKGPLEKAGGEEEVQAGLCREELGVSPSVNGMFLRVAQALLEPT